MPTALPPSRDAALEARVFWIRFKYQIAAVLVVAVLAIVGFAGYRFYSDRRDSAASALLSSAKSASDYQQVIARYPNTPAGAARLAIARALLQIDNNLRSTLKADGLLRRDPRMKERKKSGQPGARKRFQFSKR